MIITKQELTSKGKKEFDENVIFSADEFKNNPLIVAVNYLNAHVETEYVANLTLVKTHLDGELILRSTRTLKELAYEIDLDDDFVIVYDEECFDPETMILLKDDEMNFTPYFYSLVVASIPLKVISDEDEELIKGEDWEIITEDEYYRRKKDDTSNSPFSSLLDLDLDEE